MKQLTLPLFRESENAPRVQMRTLPGRQTVTTTLTPREAAFLVQTVNEYSSKKGGKA